MSYFTTKEKTILGFSILGLVLLIALALCFPLIIIFALNTVFITLSIPYTFWTWLSVYILSFVFYGKK